MDPHVNLQPVRSAEQIAELALLAEGIWREYFSGMISEELIEHVLATVQSAEGIAAQITEGYQYFFIRLGDELCGYFAFRVLPDKPVLFLSKLYIVRSSRGRGLGKAVLDYAERRAREADCRSITLTVYQGNTSAVDFYRRQGFCLKEEIERDFGNGFTAGDFVMEKSLTRGEREE
ncbi:MAG: GNAT family N-acetyltransferase [Candidatus Omnitrophota bacterium]